MTVLEYIRGIHRYLRRSFNDPRLAWHYVIYGNRQAAKLQVRRVLETLGCNTEEVERLYNNPELNKLQEGISEVLKTTQFRGIGPAGEDFYVLLRLFRPKTIIETGVASGVSTAFILKALDDNKEGVLHSVDFMMTEQEYTANVQAGRETALPYPEGKQPGFVVPQELKGRWRLNLGKSEKILPALLKELGKFDVFLHDSDHSYENMMFEFNTVWDYLPSGGLLLSHDIDMNNAFHDFAKKVRAKSIDLSFRGGIGVLIKD